jgi:hypothetical protein
MAVRFYGGGKWSPRENQCWNISLTNFNTYPYLNGGIYSIREKHPSTKKSDCQDISKIGMPFALKNPLPKFVN